MIESQTAPTVVEGTAQAVGRFVFRYRDYLAPAVLVLALVLTRPQPAFRSHRADWWLDLFGLTIAALGQALRIMVIGYAYIVRGGRNKQLAAPELVVSGFYAHCRNPMYVGNFLLLSGLVLIYNSWWLYLIGLPVMIGGLMTITLAEEHFLRQRFGADYDLYCRRVNRIVPSFRGIRQTMASMRFDWRRVMRKEYGTTFAWISIAVFLLIWERIIHFGYAARHAEINRLLLCYAPLIAAWGTVRWLKKTRRI